MRSSAAASPSAAATQSWRPDDFWWWWRASRVINTFDGGVGLDYTIQEFPFFSFILGDQKQPDGLGETVAPVPKPREEEVGERKSGEADGLRRYEPPQGVQHDLIVRGYGLPG